MSDLTVATTQPANASTPVVLSEPTKVQDTTHVPDSHTSPSPVSPPISVVHHKPTSPSISSEGAASTQTLKSDKGKKKETVFFTAPEPTPTDIIVDKAVEEANKGWLDSVRTRLRKAIDAGSFRFSLSERMSALFSIRHTHVHKVDPATSEEIKEVAKSIDTLPERIKSSVSASIGDAASWLTSGEIPLSLKGILTLFLSLVPIVLHDDIATFAAVSANLALQHGPAIAAILSGLVHLTKQYLQSRARIEEDPKLELKGDDLDAVTDEADRGALYALYATVYRYTIGAFPTTIPDGLFNAAKDANVLFSFARHAEHFGTYLVRAIKFIVNKIWYYFTGTYVFGEEARAIYERFERLVALADSLIASKHLTSSSARSIASDASDIKIACAKAGMPSDFVRLVDSFASGFVSRAAVAVQESLHQNGVRPLTFALVGPAGVGKSTFINLIAQLYFKRQGVVYNPQLHRFDYQPGLNFQNPLKLDTRVFIFDDPAVIRDKTASNEYLNLFMRLATGTPTEIQAPFETKGLGVLADGRPELLIWSANDIDTADVTESQAFWRRFNAGVWCFRTTPAFTTEHGELKTSAITEDTDLTTVWEIVDPNTRAVVSLPDFLATLFQIRAKDGQRGAALAAAISNAGARITPGKPYAYPFDELRDMTDVKLKKAARARSGDAISRVAGSAMTPLEVAAALGCTTNVAAVIVAYRDRVKRADVTTKMIPRLLDEVDDLDPRAAGEEDLVAAINDLIDYHPLELKSLTPEAEAYIRGATTERVANRVITMFQRSPKQYVMFNGGLTIRDSGRNIDVDLKAIIGTVQDVTPPTPVTNIARPIAEWSDADFNFATTQTFFVCGNDASFQDYSYGFPGSIGPAFGPDAVEVHFPDFMRWAVAHDKCGDRATRCILATMVPVQAQRAKYPLLWMLAYMLGGAIVGSFVGLAVNAMFSHFVPKSYSVRDYVKSRHARFGDLIQKGSDTTPYDALLSTIGTNTYPIAAIAGGKGAKCYMTGIRSNLAVTVAHVVKDKTTLVVGGRVAGVFALRHVASGYDPATATPSPNTVDVYPHPNIDAVYLVFPSNIPFFKNISDRFVPGTTSVDKLTKIVLARSPLKLEYSNDDPDKPALVSVSQRPAEAFPLGDAVTYGALQENDQNALLVECVTPARPGECGQLCITTNTHVGDGFRWITGIYMGTIDKFEVIAPMSLESVAAFVDAHPKLVSRIELKGDELPPVDPTPLVNPFPDRVTTPVPSDPIAFDGIVARLAPREAMPLNFRHEIVKSPIFGWADGMEYVDPITGDASRVVTTDYVPSDLHNLRGAFSKKKFNVHCVPDGAMALHRAAAQRIYARLKATSPKFFVKRPRLSWFDAINGVPEWNIGKLDMDKARGYFPGCSIKHRTDLVVRRPDDKWDVTPLLVARLEALDADYAAGKYAMPYYQCSIKPELRPIGKVGRVVNALDFERVVLLRAYYMPLVAALLDGKLRNGSMVGSDLNGDHGWLMYRAFRSLEIAGFDAYDIDASSFDATENYAFSSALEDEEAAFFCDIFDISEIHAQCLAMTARLSFHIVGDRVSFVYNGIGSGHVATTFRNTNAIEALNAAPAITAGTERHSYSYGDDHVGFVKGDPTYPARVIDHAAALGITLTAGDKSDSVGFVDPSSLVALKRRFFKNKRTGLVMAPLPASVTGRIGNYISRREHNLASAVAVAVDSAQREAYYHGDANFSRFTAALRKKLAAVGFTTPALSLVELDALHAARMPVPTQFIGGWESKLELKSDPKVVVRSVAPASIGTTVTTSQANVDAPTAVVPTSGTVTRHALTSYKDVAGANIVKMPADSMAQITNVLNPYDPAGMEKVLEREQFVGTFVFGPGTSDQAVPIDFPYNMLVNPTISARLERFKYFRAGLRLTARVTGMPSSQGLFGFAIYRGGLIENDPRTVNGVLYNAETLVVSASTSLSASVEIPWCGKSLWYDLTKDSDNQWQHGSICSIVPYVMTPYRSTSSNPGTVTITLYAQFINVQLSGFTDTGGITPVPPPPKLVHKSEEGVDKSLKGILSTAATVVDTIKPVVQGIVDVGGMLDKPQSVAMHETSLIVSAPSFTHSTGISDGTSIASRQGIQMHQAMRLAGEPNPVPSWRDIAGTPGRILQGQIPTNVAPDGRITFWRVDPAYVYTPDGNFPVYPTFVGMCACAHTFWRGTMRYIMYVACSSFQKMQLRIVYNPQYDADPAVVQDNDAGETMSMVFDITGDRMIAFEIPYNKPTYMSPVRQIGVVANELNTNGTVIVQAVSGISSAGEVVPIDFIVYQCAAPDFELFQYQGPQPNIYASFYNPQPGKIPGKLVLKATTWDMGGMEFQRFIPFSPKSMSYLVAEDRTHGPIEALKRPHGNSPAWGAVRGNLATLGRGSPLERTPIHNISTDWGYFLQMFHGWAGGVNFYIIYMGAQAGIKGAIQRGDETQIIGKSGAMIRNLSLDPTMVAHEPWIEPYLYENFIKFPGERSRYAPTLRPYVFPVITGPSPPLVILQEYVAAGDDFTVYHLLTTPIFWGDPLSSVKMTE